MVQKVLAWLKSELQPKAGETTHMKILKKGPAMRVIFFYPGEEGTYVDHAEVTLYENGIVQIASNQEETTTHLQNCEILWRFETEAEERANKLRLLKPKSDVRPADEGSSKAEASSAKDSLRSQNPENLE
ncbi:hypothetical protein EBS43_05315 [bacterium]|nr:hypothetical protein [bacterium]